MGTSNRIECFICMNTLDKCICTKEEQERYYRECIESEGIN